MTSSFDHLVGAGIQRHGPDDMERPGGPQVDDRLKPDRRLYWQVFGLAPLRMLPTNAPLEIGQKSNSLAKRRKAARKWDSLFSRMGL